MEATHCVNHPWHLLYMQVLCQVVADCRFERTCHLTVSVATIELQRIVLEQSSGKRTSCLAQMTGMLQHVMTFIGLCHCRRAWLL